MSNLITPKHPLAEVFGFASTDMSANANRHRSKRLCPFNNKVPNCTKDKAQDPLGVCSVFHDGEVVITWAYEARRLLDGNPDRIITFTNGDLTSCRVAKDIGLELFERIALERWA